MAADVGNSIGLIFLPSHRKDELRKIWHLEHLSIASSDRGLWIKGLKGDDLLEIRKLVDATSYEVKDEFLYLPGNKVPERREVKGLLWSNIQKLIRLELPSFNENLFEVNGNIEAKIIPVSTEHEVAASIVGLEDLSVFVNQNPSYIFDSFKWCLLSDNQCFILGDNVFDIQSDRFWKFQSLLIPVGYDFSSDLTRSLFSSTVDQSKNYVVFDDSGTYFELPKDKLTQLSRSSVKLTLSKLHLKNE